MEVTRQEALPYGEAQFKSPLRLLLRSYRKSREKWKAKAINRGGRIKDLEHKVRDMDQSRTRWKSKAKQLHAENKALKERLRQVEAERDQLQAQMAAEASKKAPRPVAR